VSALYLAPGFSNPEQISVHHTVSLKRTRTYFENQKLEVLAVFVQVISENKPD